MFVGPRWVVVCVGVYDKGSLFKRGEGMGASTEWLKGKRGYPGSPGPLGYLGTHLS